MCQTREHVWSKAVGMSNRDGGLGNLHKNIGWARWQLWVADGGELPRQVQAQEREFCINDRQTKRVCGKSDGANGCWCRQRTNFDSKSRTGSTFLPIYQFVTIIAINWLSFFRNLKQIYSNTKVQLFDTLWGKNIFITSLKPKHFQELFEAKQGALSF